MASYNVAEAKAHLSEILEQVLQGEEVVLTRRGEPLARIVPAKTATSIIGAGRDDGNINRDVIAGDAWWQPLTDDEVREWYG
jgi:prevent-host-death family protein